MEEYDYENTRDIEGMEFYLSKYPEGKYGESVKEKVEEEYYSRAKNPDGVEAYLSKYPNGRYSEKLIKERNDKNRAIKESIEKNMVAVKGGRVKVEELNWKGDFEVKYYSDRTDFYISKYEVTQGEYEEIMGYNPSKFSGRAANPVDSVTWYDAVIYCNKLSEICGFTPYYQIKNIEYYGDENKNSVRYAKVEEQKGNGYRLPLEAEWQLAAMEGKNRSLFSKKYSGSSKITEVAWYGENSNQESHPVGQKKPNEFGLYDMSGNVREWCMNWYSNGYKCLRGGAWHYNFKEQCEVGTREETDIDCR